MATFSNLAYFPVTNKFSSNRASYDPNKKSLNNIKMNGTITKYSTTKVEMESTLTSFTSVTENGYISEQQVRQNISITKQSVDHYRQGMIIEGGVGYRQRVVIRSYEVGPDKTATMESIVNILQETASNHMRMSGLISDEFGATHGMMKNDLIWVVSRMPIQVDRYPSWGEVLEIDTWVGASGKNGMRRDWLIRSEATGHVFARATSTWVMMNRKTGCLSEMPKEVRAEIEPWFIEKQAITEDVVEEIVKVEKDLDMDLDKNLKPKRSDLDMSHHVNNVKYVRWMLETIPDQILEARHQLTSIVLESRRECVSSDIVQFLYQPDEDGILKNGLKQEKYTSLVKGFSLAEYIKPTALQIILILVGFLRAHPTFPKLSGIQIQVLKVVLLAYIMRRGSTSVASTILLPVLIFSLFLIHVQGKLNQAGCSSSCGDIDNIKYPFRLRGDPSSCGDPDYEFSCVNNKTILEVFPGKYYVKSISYTDNLLGLVDVNFANGSCSLPSGSLKNRDGVVQDFRYKGEVDFATESLIRFVKCSSNVTLQFNKMLHYNYTEVPCLSRNGTYMYAVVDGRYEANNYPRTCSLVSLAPVNYHDELYKKIPTYEAVAKALQAGFDIGWSVECRDCSLAGKYCVYGPKASDTRPIIFQCQKEYHEITRFEGNLIIAGIVVGGVIGLVIIVAVLVCVICKSSREKCYKQIQAAIAKYLKIKDNINEGLKFYVTLQDAITNNVKQQCSDFVMTRNIQCQEMIEDVHKQMAGLNFQDSKNSAAYNYPFVGSHSQRSGSQQQTDLKHPTTDV
ncbi:hypothetical protein ACLB2K_039430 [Fragaria x ananassa]